MTRYDTPSASDGRGGSHPLAGVPQSALDAAEAALWDAGPRDNVYLHIDQSEVREVAHAILIAASEQVRTMRVGVLAEYRWHREQGLSPVRAMATVQQVEQAHLLHAEPGRFERSAVMAAEAGQLFEVIARRMRGPSAAYWSDGGRFDPATLERL